MAEKHIANAEASWQAVCIPPDWCKVGKKLIPFDSYRDLSHEMVASPNVNARGTPVYRITDWVRGTDANAGRAASFRRPPKRQVTCRCCVMTPPSRSTA